MSSSNKIKLNTVLYSIILALVIVLIIGTITGLVKKNESPSDEVLLQQGKAINLSAPANTDFVAYYEIGSIRIVITKNSNNEDASQIALTDQNDLENTCVLVVNPWVSYAEGDTVFYEEIARKRGVIKGICTTYFSERSKDHLLSITETKVEQELMELINAQLSLGKIQDLYFTDYIFLE